MTAAKISMLETDGGIVDISNTRSSAMLKTSILTSITQKRPKKVVRHHCIFTADCNLFELALSKASTKEAIKVIV